MALDKETIQSLRDLDDSGDFIREIGQLFISAAPKNIAEMRAAMQKGTFTAITKLAHQMKSSGGNLGALHYSELCQRLEEFRDWQDLEALKALISSIEVEFQSVRAELEAEMKK